MWCPVLNSNVDCSIYSGRDYAQDEIILNLVYLFRSRRVFLVLTFTSWRYGSRRLIMDEFGVGTFSSIINCPLVHGSYRETWLLLGVLPTNWYHVSWPYWQEIMLIYLTEEHATCLLFIRLCRFRCQGPLPINSWFPLLPSSFLKFPFSITLVLDPRLEVPCVHKFPSSYIQVYSNLRP